MFGDNSQLGPLPPRPLRHEALIYDDDRQLAEHVAPFLAEGVDRGEPTIAVIARNTWTVLRQALGPAATEVTFIPYEDHYVSPIRALAGYDDALRRLLAEGATSVRVTGEIPLGPTPGEWAEWTAYEAIVNQALADRPLSVLCLYDSRTAPDQVLEGVWRTHPEIHTNAPRRRPHYHEPEEVVSAMQREPVLLTELRELPLTDDPVRFRELLGAELAAAAVPAGKGTEMLLAANEVFNNATLHGGGPRLIRAGKVDARFVVEIADDGPGLDPLAGFLPPRPELQRGTGLWAARRLVARLEIVPSARGAAVRLWL